MKVEIYRLRLHSFNRFRDGVARRSVTVDRSRTMTLRNSLEQRCYVLYYEFEDLGGYGPMKTQRSPFSR